MAVGYIILNLPLCCSYSANVWQSEIKMRQDLVCSIAAAGGVQILEFKVALLVCENLVCCSCQKCLLGFLKICISFSSCFKIFSCLQLTNMSLFYYINCLTYIFAVCKVFLKWQSIAILKPSILFQWEDFWWFFGNYCKRNFIFLLHPWIIQKSRFSRENCYKISKNYSLWKCTLVLCSRTYLIVYTYI